MPRREFGMTIARNVVRDVYGDGVTLERNVDRPTRLIGFLEH